jgi:hypothetical protein
MSSSDAIHNAVCAEMGHSSGITILRKIIEYSITTILGEIVTI